jgi:hypothetical protein
MKYIVQIAGITCEFDTWQEREDFIEVQKYEFGHTDILTAECE